VNTTGIDAGCPARVFNAGKQRRRRLEIRLCEIYQQKGRTFAEGLRGAEPGFRVVGVERFSQTSNSTGRMFFFEKR
jgi:hypothetical protein